MYGSGHVTSDQRSSLQDGLICLQIFPQKEKVVDGKIGTNQQDKKKKMPPGTRRGTFGFTRTGGSIWQHLLQETTGKYHYEAASF